MDLLLIIDMQNQFINKQTEHLVKKINTLKESKRYGKVVFTRFINSKKNPTYKMGWHGCISNKEKQLCINTDDEDTIIDKSTYSAYNTELVAYLKKNRIRKIYICGVDIDCCVLITAINLFENGFDVYVLKEHVGCMQGEEYKNEAISLLERNIGKDRIIEV